MPFAIDKFKYKNGGIRLIQLKVSRIYLTSLLFKIRIININK